MENIELLADATNAAGWALSSASGGTGWNDRDYWTAPWRSRLGNSKPGRELMR